MDRIDDLVYHLQGTCISLEEACADLGFRREDLTTNDLEELNNWLFRCEECGWWGDVAERSLDREGNICVYCAAESRSNGYEEY